MKMDQGDGRATRTVRSLAEAGEDPDGHELAYLSRATGHSAREIGHAAQAARHERSTGLPAAPEECVGLERAAVWDAHHIERRLLDTFLGLPNQDERDARVRLS
ncbi:hypothetical protein ACHGLA_01160 [Streptomyces sp. YH02]|uniref:hypothetical protein n=1 Tax=Streptomyces sp. YH02 TaxID=3256999 RepID=UPI003757E657